jgi:hypothetical protein
MSYLVKVVGPSGSVRFLTADQREVEYTEDAAVFENFEEADAVAFAYEVVVRRCWANPPLVLVSVADPS